mgnify:CR=1 FL=1
MIKRIIQIREQNELNQEKFAARLGLSRNFINQVENGKKNFSDRTISDICKEFNINEDWLRTGQGNMYKEADDKLSSYVAEIAIGNDEFIKDLITVYMELDDTSKAALKKIAYAMAEKREKREQD